MYKVILDFYLSNQKYGKLIEFTITILEDKNQKKINEFNRLYALEEKDFSDEVI